MLPKIVKKVKDATVGIGIRVPTEPNPRYVGGSGVFIDPEGYVMTAEHVISNCMQEQANLKAEGIDAKITTLRYAIKDKILTYHYRDLIGGSGIKTKPINGIEYGWDVFLAKTVKKGNTPFLKIKKPSKLNVMDEIAMCGYPGGDATLTLEPDPTKLTVGPILQQGRISGLIPHDDLEVTQGIQTDIIGTGGSSGSPLINVEDGLIIGIALQVIGNFYYVLVGEKYVKKEINTGLVSGVSNYVLQGLEDTTKAWNEGKEQPVNITMQYSDISSEVNFE